LSPNEDQTKTIDRQVTISGTPEAQWKSQYYIYDKIRQEGYAGDDEVRLRAEIYVPTSLIGRLVGKGGQNVSEDRFILINKTIDPFLGSSITTIDRCDY
jgi:insulin-like growth factor 2 mRNA-binding protein 1